MAYSNQYLLNRIVEIQNIVLTEKKSGMKSQKQIYEEIIAPKYYISYSTFNNYLARNAKKELSNLSN